MAKKLLLSWSGGKDSAMALYELEKAREWEIAALLTTVTGDYDRVSMHGVRRELLESQAESLGLPLETILISKTCTNEEYETKMQRSLERFKSQGITNVAFGDIFLEDLRKYREDKLAIVGMEAVFPIWKRESSKLAQSFIRLGFQAITTCVDGQALDGRFAGRHYDQQFLAELPQGVDPCGENGEFHSFAFGGPIFKTPIAFEKGETVLRDNRFYFCDLLPLHR